MFEFVGDTLDKTQISCISEVLNNLGCEGKVIIEPVGQVGDNYACDVKRIKTEKDGKPFNIIAKVAPTIEIMRQQMGAKLFFSNETTMYTKVLPKFIQLQADAGVPEDKRFKFAKCYGFLAEEPYEIILLEDLTMHDYGMLDKMQSLSDDTIRIVLKNLATLHALSYVLKYKEPLTFEQFDSQLFDLYEHMNQQEATQITFAHIEADFSKIFEGKYKNAMKGTLSTMVPMGKKISKSDANSKHSVFLHGDSWTNNILFKLQEGVTTDCVLIDYQLSKKSLPVADLHYMLFNCTDYKTRAQHYYEWLDFYHSELDDNLSTFGLKANLVYPRDQLDADLKRYAKLVFSFSLMVASVTLRKSEESEVLKKLETDNIDELTEAFKVTTLNDNTVLNIKQRIEGLIDSCYDFGYFTSNYV